MTNKTVLLELLNLNQLVDERVIEALRRLDQIDDLALWYEGFNPIPLLQGLAAHSGASGHLNRSIRPPLFSGCEA